MSNEWRAAAIREMIDIAHWLTQGGFESKREFLDRLANTTRAIELLGEETSKYRVQKRRYDQLSIESDGPDHNE